ncbi:MAG: hypothetical protein QW724_03915 [Nitrososphaerota archaeon]
MQLARYTLEDNCFPVEREGLARFPVKKLNIAAFHPRGARIKLLWP